jgi:hypothetical protein
MGMARSPEEGGAPIAVARLQSAHDFQVVRGAADHVLVLVGHESLHHQRRFDQRRQRPHQARAAGEFVDASVKLTVEIADTLQVTLGLAQRLVILILGKLAQLGDAFDRHPAGSTRGAISLEQRAQLEHVVAILSRPLGNDRSLMWNELE